MPIHMIAASPLLMQLDARLVYIDGICPPNIIMLIMIIVIIKIMIKLIRRKRC